MSNLKLRGALVFGIILAVGVVSSAGAQSAEQEVSDDETLIYLIEEKGLGGVKFNISLNDEIVGRMKHKQFTSLRVKAGRLTLSIWRGRNVFGAIALDDRPGEVVYLRHKWGVPQIFEISAEEYSDLQRKLKPAKQESVANIEYPPDTKLLSLVNIGRLGFELMMPSKARLKPDDEHAVITLFRREEFPGVPFSVWGDDGLVASLQMNEAVDIRVPTGEYYFFATQTGTTVMRAQVKAGEQYYAWLDIGKLRANLRLTPVAPEQSSDLGKWMSLLQWVELNEEAMTRRVRERANEVAAHFAGETERARNGVIGFQELTAGHALRASP